MRENSTILLVDDDRYLAESMALWLSEQGYSVETAGSLAAARPHSSQSFDMLITDLRLDDGDGFDLIAETKRSRPAARSWW